MEMKVWRQKDWKSEAMNQNYWRTLWLLNYYKQPTINLRNSCGEESTEITDCWYSRVEDQYQKSESGEINSKRKLTKLWETIT